MAVIWDDKGCGCWMPPALFSLGCTRREGCGGALIAEEREVKLNEQQN